MILNIHSSSPHSKVTIICPCISYIVGAPIITGIHLGTFLFPAVHFTTTLET